MNPKVSVIIPNFNHAAYLPKRIESVLNQTFTNIQIIIVDDCSTDNSIEIIRKYASLDKRITQLENKTNSGNPFRQWKRGIELAIGEYLWIAESDDYSDIQFLEVMLAAMENRLDCEIGYCQSMFVNEQGNIIGSHLNNLSVLNPTLWHSDFCLPGKEIIGSYMPIINVIPNAGAVVFKRNKVNFVNWEQVFSYKLAGDRYFWIQIMRDTNLAFVSRPMNFFRIHQNTVRSKHTKSIGYLKEIIRVNQHICQISSPDRRTKIAAIRQWHRSARKLLQPLRWKHIFLIPQLLLLLLSLCYIFFIENSVALKKPDI